MGKDLLEKVFSITGIVSVFCGFLPQRATTPAVSKPVKVPSSPGAADICSAQTAPSIAPAKLHGC